MEVNTEKTKIIGFRKGGGKGVKSKWWWKGKELEEMKEVTYLGYRFKRNRGQEEHVRERESEEDDRSDKTSMGNMEEEDLGETGKEECCLIGW